MGSLTTAQIGGVLGDVLAGLEHAEQRGIVHRDLKPENLLVTDEGRVKIADFGIAKATTAPRASNTQTGVAVGTPGYMAPEQAMGQNVGRWSDLYSVGCMAYELFVGLAAVLRAGADGADASPHQRAGRARRAGEPRA